MICTTQRSGSNLLCQLLTQTGRLGRPLDYFNGQGLRAKGWADYPDDAEAQFARLQAQSVTDNGVYGFKLFGHQVEALARIGWTERLPDLRWIYLHRTSLLDQAISLVMAKQTGQWRATADAQDVAAYDHSVVEAELVDLTRTNAWWRLFFARNGLAPLELTYEALVAEPLTTVAAVADALQEARPSAIDLDQVEVRRQRTWINQAWGARFREESQDMSRFADPSVELSERAPSGASEIDVLAFSAPDDPRFSRPDPPAGGSDAEKQDRVQRRAENGSPVWFRIVPSARPRLTVSILTRDSENRLPRLLAEAAQYADQILVGIDASSTDASFEVARSLADTVYRFRLPNPGQLAPARMLAFQFATGDWVLSLDDDEGMDAAFDELLPELMAAQGVTHHHFPRKWVVQDVPGAYLHADPWFPNWSRRMIRNDASLVWKPPQPHSQYFVMGPGSYESRTNILHFEPLLSAEADRQAKRQAYLDAGAAPESERFYEGLASAPRRPVALRPSLAARPRPTPCVAEEAIWEPSLQPFAPWNAQVLGVDMPGQVTPGDVVVFEALVRNTGRLAWSPSYTQWPTKEWPMIRLSYHLLRHDGVVLESDGRRYLLNRYVAPDSAVSFIDSFRVPDKPGDYIVEWDMLSEAESWFALLGAEVFRTHLRVGSPPISPL